MNQIILDNCAKESRNAKSTFKDNKGCDSKYLIDNKSGNSFYKIDFENCVYKGNSIDTKCDWGLKTDTTIHYIELKGCDVKKGVKQLLSTIIDTEKLFKRKGSSNKFLNRKARLIVSKFPKPDIVKKTADYKNLIRKTNNGFVIKQNQFTEMI